ncbi:hypothetical protein FN846DRAFT_909404 [Sphaerosporella brunnea]|uniref:Uncharacterized protein n=1 Tax=Sphaerosporella brunnea TaxID=1250544 RepID=A0A5J5EPY8_9PEZI|nr:hypothetical protein FN846DRAFT_909404 [Sphaerosporella brunnea]
MPDPNGPEFRKPVSNSPVQLASQEQLGQALRDLDRCEQIPGTITRSDLWEMFSNKAGFQKDLEFPLGPSKKRKTPDKSS